MTNERYTGPDVASVSSLYGAYLLPLATWIDRQFKGSVDAESVAHKAIVRASQKIAKFDPSKASLKTWLFEIAKRIALDELKRRRIRPWENAESLSDPAVKPSVPGPAEHYERARKKELLWRTVNSLPREQRFPVILCCMMKRTQKEAAQRLHTTERTVFLRQHEGLFILRRRLTRAGITSFD